MILIKIVEQLTISPLIRKKAPGIPRGLSHSILAVILHHNLHALPARIVIQVRIIYHADRRIPFLYPRPIKRGKLSLPEAFLQKTIKFL